MQTWRVTCYIQVGPKWYSLSSETFCLFVKTFIVLLISFFLQIQNQLLPNMLLIRLSRLHALRGLLLTNSKINKCILNPSVNLHLRSVLRNPNLSSDVSKTELINTKTNPEKDRLLFYYENPRFYYFLNGFGFVQFFFWVHLSEFTYKKLKEVNVDENISSARPFWWQKLSFKDETTRTLVASFCFFMGKFVIFLFLSFK